MKRIAHRVRGLRHNGRRNGHESGQTLVEYALIIALLSLGAIAALGFLSGKVNSLFSVAGNSLNATPVAVAPKPFAPPPSGTSVAVDPDGAGPLPLGTYTYLNPGPAHTSGNTADCGGSHAACSGHAGFYHRTVGLVSGRGSSFTSNVGSWSGGYASIPTWTLSCRWRTNGIWAGPYEAGCW